MAPPNSSCCHLSNNDSPNLAYASLAFQAFSIFKFYPLFVEVIVSIIVRKPNTIFNNWVEFIDVLTFLNSYICFLKEIYEDILEYLCVSLGLCSF